MDTVQLKLILEAALFAANEPLSLERLTRIVSDDIPNDYSPSLQKEDNNNSSSLKNGNNDYSPPLKKGDTTLSPPLKKGGQGGFNNPSLPDIKASLAELAKDYEERSIELKEVASGYCFRVKTDYSHWLNRLGDERPARYSRALLETLAIIVYRQPITRAEIEDIRGVSLNTNILRTLLEQNWIRIIGQREVPGKPNLFGTTKELLDHLNLKSLQELPALEQLPE